jgi:hypothetical protein
MEFQSSLVTRRQWFFQRLALHHIPSRHRQAAIFVVTGKDTSTLVPQHAFPITDKPAETTEYIFILFYADED